MPRYFCDYCDTYLTHDSPSVRKTHNGGRKHKDNVRLFYQQWMEEQAQKLVDATQRAYAQGKPGMPPYGMRPGPGGAMIPPPAGMGMNMGGRPPYMPMPGMYPPRGMGMGMPQGVGSMAAAMVRPPMPR